jgi:glutamate racemase
LVPLVEEGWVEHSVTEQVAKIYLGEAFGDGFNSADVLLLGCTHYPLLKPILQRVVPENVTLVDSAESVALAVLNPMVLGTSNGGPGQVDGVKTLGVRLSDTSHLRFFVTDSVEKFRRFGTRFLGQEIRDITHVDLKE